MSDDHPFDAVLDAAFHEGQHLRNKAKLRALPPNPAAWLDDAESYAESLPDEMPHKSVILYQVRRARINLANGNSDEVKFYMLQIEENHSSAVHDKWLIEREDRDSKELDGARKGGRQPKRRVWAEAMAKTLAEETDRAPPEAAWRWLAGNTVRHLFEFNETDYEVYVDGSKLVGRDVSTGAEPELKKSVFLKNYYGPARKAG